MSRVFVRCSLVTLLLLGSSLAQTKPEAVGSSSSMAALTRIFGSEDKDVALPRATLPLGRKDASAIQLLTSFLTDSNLLRWPGIQANGTFTDMESSYPAVLTILGGNQCRLDIADPAGARSIRIHGGQGVIQESSAAKHSLPVSTASLGLFALETLVEHLSDIKSSILDGGLVSVDGVTLHLMTLQVPSRPDINPASAEEVSVLDLYFDQNMRQLRKSVSLIRVDNRDRAYYLQSETYSDYRRVGDSTLPFSFAQTLNGQRQWTLQLTAVHTNPAVAASYFRF